MGLVKRGSINSAINGSSRPRHEFANTPGLRSSANDYGATIRKLRGSRRIATSIVATCGISGSKVQVEIRNLSQTGPGIRGVPILQVGSSLVVVLAEGQELECTVCWSRMGFCGLQFKTPLAEADPLLANLSIKSQPATTLSAVVAFPGMGAVSSHKRHPWSRLNGDRPASEPARWKTCVAWFTRYRDAKTRRAIERACRKQGFAWLTTADPAGPPTVRPRTAADATPTPQTFHKRNGSK